MSRKSCDLAKKRMSWRLFEKTLKNGGDVNASLVTTVSQAGYTALHLAVLEDSEYFVNKLIVEYKANVNCTGEDGAQPIHLAVLCEHEVLVQILLDNGADVDAELTKELVDKYTKNQKWNDNFGGKMTLFTFTIINTHWQLMRTLVDWGANVAVKDNKNKTLIMYAVENKNWQALFVLGSGSFIYNSSNIFQIINARDDDDLHVIHYILPCATFGEFRYNGRIEFQIIQGILTEKLIFAGANPNAMVNDNPDTLLINRAAYRCCQPILEKLLNLEFYYSPKAKPLHYFMIPVNSDKYGLSDDFIQNPIDYLKRKRNECLKIILEYLTLRRALGMFIPDEEIELMDQLVAKDLKLKKIVNDYEKDFINKLLKTTKIYYGHKSITFYDLAVKIFDSKSLKLLAKDNELVEACQEFNEVSPFHDSYMFLRTMSRKINRTCYRREIMKEIEKIPLLLKFIPLPYEIILMVIEYIDNYDLEEFVNAFYQDPIFNYDCYE